LLFVVDIFFRIFFHYRLLKTQINVEILEK